MMVVCAQVELLTRTLLTTGPSVRRRAGVADDQRYLRELCEYQRVIVEPNDAGNLGSH